MSATVAPSPAPWASSSSPPSHGPRRGGDAGARWVLGRRCSISPGQMLTCYLSLCAVSLGIAAVFWLHGAGVVMLFAGVELAAVGVALLVHARHALDRETLEIDGDHLRVVREHGGRVEHWQFRLAWLRVEPSRGQGSLIELSGDGRRVRVGRYIRAEARQQLARELRREIRAAAVVPAAAAVVRD